MVTKTSLLLLFALSIFVSAEINVPNAYREFYRIPVTQDQLEHDVSVLEPLVQKFDHLRDVMLSDANSNAQFVDKLVEGLANNPRLRKDLNKNGAKCAKNLDHLLQALGIVGKHLEFPTIFGQLMKAIKNTPKLTRETINLPATYYTEEVMKILYDGTFKLRLTRKSEQKDNDKITTSKGYFQVKLEQLIDEIVWLCVSRNCVSKNQIEKDTSTWRKILESKMTPESQKFAQAYVDLNIARMKVIFLEVFLNPTNRGAGYEREEVGDDSDPSFCKSNWKLIVGGGVISLLAIASYYVIMNLPTSPPNAPTRTRALPFQTTEAASSLSTSGWVFVVLVLLAVAGSAFYWYKYRRKKDEDVKKVNSTLSMDEPSEGDDKEQKHLKKKHKYKSPKKNKKQPKKVRHSQTRDVTSSSVVVQPVRKRVTKKKAARAVSNVVPKKPKNYKKRTPMKAPSSIVPSNPGNKDTEQIDQIEHKNAKKRTQRVVRTASSVASSDQGTSTDGRSSLIVAKTKGFKPKTATRTPSSVAPSDPTSKCLKTSTSALSSPKCSVSSDAP